MRAINASLVTLLTVAAPLAAQAQPAGTVCQIGYLRAAVPLPLREVF